MARDEREQDADPAREDPPKDAPGEQGADSHELTKDLDPGDIYGGRSDAAGAEDDTPGVSRDAAG